MAKADIKGAFVQTPIEGPDVYMRVRQKVVAYLLVMYPEYAEYVQADVSVVTLLLEAMYGCVQASKLWYKLLIRVLTGAGYVVSETDPCVLRRVVDGMTFVILIYVDDLLIFAMKKEIEALRALLTEAFKTITMEIGASLSYIGMQIEWSVGAFVIGMDYYLEHQGGPIQVGTAVGVFYVFQGEETLYTCIV